MNVKARLNNLRLLATPLSYEAVADYIGGMDSSSEQIEKRPAVPQMPQRPDPPQQSSTERQRGCASILLASLAGLILLAMFIVLTLSFGWVPLVAVAIFGGMFLVAYLHYITWGWWLGQQIRREEAETDDEE